MYRGFNLRLEQLSVNNEKWEEIKNFLDNAPVKKDIKEQFEKYLDVTGTLNGTNMQEDWFPTVHAHIFISHSHQDEILAGFLAYRLFKQFGIISFIDSFVWGYADELLKTIDNKYCLNDDKHTYNYQTRNYSTSHVHMMLATALTKMIDKTECIIFLNTPNSVVSDGIVDQTYSPWIYHEIATTKIIRQNTPERIGKKRELTKESAEFAEKSLQIGYEIDLDNLALIDFNILMDWLKSGNNKPDTALDWLYENVKPAEKEKYEILKK